MIETQALFNPLKKPGCGRGGMGRATAYSLLEKACEAAGTELVCGLSDRSADEWRRKGDRNLGREASVFPRRWQMPFVGSSQFYGPVQPRDEDIGK